MIDDAGDGLAGTLSSLTDAAPSRRGLPVSRRRLRGRGQSLARRSRRRRRLALRRRAAVADDDAADAVDVERGLAAVVVADRPPHEIAIERRFFFQAEDGIRDVIEPDGFPAG